MKILIRDLLKFDDIDNYDLEFNRLDPIYTSVFVLDGKSTKKVSVVTGNDLSSLQGNSNNEISIITDKKFRDKLKEVNDSYDKKSSGKKRLGELLAEAKEYELMNLKSLKKRSIMILDDVCAAKSSELFGSSQLLIEYGAKLSSKLIKKVDNRINNLAEVDLKDSEEGVLVFIPDPKDFKLKVDLFAILASLELEIYDAKDPEEAIELYKIHSPKLVILGDINQSTLSKSVILELEKYDPYLKKMNYCQSPASNRKFETDRIKSNYYSGYTKIIEIVNKNKESLPEEIKKDILSAIKRLGSDFSDKNYIETAYSIKQFGRMFNVISLWNMLENIKKDRTGSI